jgi:hypothetical protein
MSQPPEPVGAPSHLAEAEEMPGCVVSAVKLVFGLPIWLIRELPTLPLDGAVLAYEKGKIWGLALYLGGLSILLGACCWAFSLVLL